MREKRTVSGDALCPFYQKEYAEKIDCLSMEQGTVCQICFKGHVPKDRFKATHCCSFGFKECEYYKAQKALIEKRMADAERRKKHNKAT